MLPILRPYTPTGGRPAPAKYRFPAPAHLHWPPGTLWEEELEATIAYFDALLGNPAHLHVCRLRREIPMARLAETGSPS